MGVGVRGTNGVNRGIGVSVGVGTGVGVGVGVGGGVGAGVRVGVGTGAGVGVGAGVRVGVGSGAGVGVGAGVRVGVGTGVGGGVGVGVGVGAGVGVGVTSAVGIGSGSFWVSRMVGRGQSKKAASKATAPPPTQSHFRLLVEGWRTVREAACGRGVSVGGGAARRSWGGAAGSVSLAWMTVEGALAVSPSVLVGESSGAASAEVAFRSAM